MLIQCLIRRQLICRADRVMNKASAIARQTDRDSSSKAKGILILDYKAQEKSIWVTVYSCPDEG